VKDESVVIGQRQRIGDQFVQLGIFEPQWRLNLAPQSLLAEDIGDVIGAEGTRCVRFANSGGDRLRSIVTNQDEQFSHLSREGAIGVRQAP